MSAYLEACLSALQNSDDKRLAGYKFDSLSRGGSYYIFVYRPSWGSEDLEFELICECELTWVLDRLSLDCNWLASEDARHVIAVFEVLISVPRGGGDD